jgi:Zn-dependent protease with chaperone function
MGGPARAAGPASAGDTSAAVGRILGQIEASRAGCRPVDAGHPGRLLIESELAALKRVSSLAAETNFEVLDCDADGFVQRGGAVILSVRMTRLNPAQRFFIMAHELGHLQLQHLAAVSGFVARAVVESRDENEARQQVLSGLSGLSHANEFDADAFAVRLMRQAGQDPEQAARLFDAIGDSRDNRTHPSAARRAQAIRSLAP